MSAMHDSSTQIQYHLIFRLNDWEKYLHPLHFADFFQNTSSHL